MLQVSKFIDLNLSNVLNMYDHRDLYVLASVPDDDKAFDTFETIKDYYYTNESERPFERLKKSFSFVRDPGREILIAARDGDKIYFLCYGGAGVMLMRGGKILPLIKTSKDERLMASGILKEGDRFIAATHEVLANLPIETIEDQLIGDDLEAAATRFGELLADNKKSGLALFAVGDVSQNKHVPGKISNISEESQSASAPKFKDDLPPARKKVVEVIDKLIAKLPDRSLVVQDQDYAFRTKSKKRTASVVGTILIGLLFVSISFGVRQSGLNNYRKSFEPQMQEARHNLEEAKELADLSPVQAQELILDARDIVNSLIGDGIEDEELSKLAEEIRQSLGPIAGIYESKTDLFLDLSLISSGFTGEIIDFSGDNIRVLDRENKKLVGIEVETKRTEVVSGPDYLPDAISTFAYDKRSFILSTDGVREVTEEVELVIKPDWDSGSVIAKAFSGNVYVLDKNESKIWRHQGVRGGFLEAEEWLGEGISPDFSGAIDMAIDGFIWVLSEGGEIERYSLGVPRGFAVSGLRGGLEQATKIFTKEEMENVYLLDPANSRIIYASKEGQQYMGEYRAEKLGNALDFIVTDTKIIFLADGKLYEISI